MRWLLGISLGYSKLQAAIGRGDGTPFRSVLRERIEDGVDATTLLSKLSLAVRKLLLQAKLDRSQVAGVVCGFRGPVDPAGKLTLGGPHGHDWNQMPLAEWFTTHFEWSARICRDVEAAARAEAAWGAGRGFDPLLYVHAGSQITGALIYQGEIYRGLGLAADLGHLRPGNAPRHISHPALTVNALASGLGMVDRAQRVLADWNRTQTFVDQRLARPAPPLGPSSTATPPTPAPERTSVLMRMVNSSKSSLTAELLAQAASQGDRLSGELMTDAAESLGWAIGQAVTLFHPARVVIGGGLSRLGLEAYLEPLRRACRAEVSPQLTAGWRAANDTVCPGAPAAADSNRATGVEIVPGTLGESAALHGALLLARSEFLPQTSLRAISPEASE